VGLLGGMAEAEESRDLRLMIWGKLQERRGPAAPLRSAAPRSSRWARTSRAEASAAVAFKGFPEMSCGTTPTLQVATRNQWPAATHPWLIPAGPPVQPECRACPARIARQ